MRASYLGPITMARPTVLSYASGLLIALLITSADCASQIESVIPVKDDCELGECYGADMFPEKSFDLKPVDRAQDANLRSARTVSSCDADICGAGDADLKILYKENVESPLEQMKVLVAKQQEQLEHLERLTKLLQQFTSKLEDGALDSLKLAGVVEETSFPLTIKTPVEGKKVGALDTTKEGGVGSLQTAHFKDGNVQEIKGVEDVYGLPGEGVHVSPKKPEHGYGGGMTVARYKPAWSEHFQFLSAVKVDGKVTCLHALPHEGEEGLSKYVAVGVDTGRVYIFLSHGDLLLDFQTASLFPITAILSFPLRRNETTFLTGHSDGTVLVHKLWEMRHSGPSYGDDWHSLSMEHVMTLATPVSDIPAVDPSSADQKPVKQSTLQSSIRILEVYRIGKMRYILISDSERNIEVFRDNGTFYGAAKASSQPLAFLRSPNSQRLLFLTQDGVASLDLRSLAVRSGPCEGLDGARVVAYAFDATGRSKAYGFTDEGHLIYVALSGDSLHFECHVRSKRKLDVGRSVVAQGIKGYLLVVTPSQVLVYNTTLQGAYAYNSVAVGGPRLLFASSLDEISLSFSSRPIQSNIRPILACNRERLVVLGFGDGYVGMYKSNLLVQKSANFSSRAWSSPFIIVILMLVGGWHFFGKKRDASVPVSEIENPLASNSAGIPGYLRTGTDEPTDALGDSRRYSSPSKAFPGSAAGSYGAGTLKYRSPVEQSFRTPGETSFRGSTSVDPSLRGTSLEPYFQRELPDSKFRAANVEASFQSSLAESSSYLKRELELKAARGSSSLQPRIKSLHEPNSF